MSANTPQNHWQLHRLFSSWFRPGKQMFEITGLFGQWPMDSHSVKINDVCYNRDRHRSARFCCHKALGFVRAVRPIPRPTASRKWDFLFGPTLVDCDNNRLQNGSESFQQKMPDNDYYHNPDGMLLWYQFETFPVFFYGWLHLFYYPRPVMAFRYCHRLRVSVCVCVCVRQSSVCPDDNLWPAQATITKIRPEVQNTLVKIAIVLGFIDIDLQREIELKSHNLPHFGLVSLSGR